MKTKFYTENLKYIHPRFNNINNEIKIIIDDELYRPITKKEDSLFFQNDWATIAFRGFEQIKQKRIIIDNMCIIGTGSGLDAIGAIEIFNPKKLLITDLTLDILAKAKANISHNINSYKLSSLKTLPSDIFSTFDKSTFKSFDLIYENLPVLPLSNSINYNNQPPNASFIDLKIRKEVPYNIKNNLLTSHYVFLRDAKKYLNKDGAILCNIGKRVELNILKNIFIDLGYNPLYLIYDIKKQNEADTNLKAYFEWEKNHEETIFTFFDFNKIQNILKNTKFEYNKLSGFEKNYTEVNKIILENRLSAKEALSAHKRGIVIGHEVLLIYAKPISNI